MTLYYPQHLLSSYTPCLMEVWFQQFDWAIKCLHKKKCSNPEKEIFSLKAISNCHGSQPCLIFNFDAWFLIIKIWKFRVQNFSSEVQNSLENTLRQEADFATKSLITHGPGLSALLSRKDHSWGLVDPKLGWWSDVLEMWHISIASTAHLCGQHSTHYILQLWWHKLTQINPEIKATIIRL